MFVFIACLARLALFWRRFTASEKVRVEMQLCVSCILIDTQSKEFRLSSDYLRRSSSKLKAQLIGIIIVLRSHADRFFSLSLGREKKGSDTLPALFLCRFPPSLRWLLIGVNETS